MLDALLDGRDRTAGELAFTANISAQSASGHLSKLEYGGLLKVRSAGRHRYYGLASAEVAHAIESLGAIASRPRAAAVGHGPRISGVDESFYLARSCYDHLAGKVAVELAARLEALNVIRQNGGREYEIGPAGRGWFAKLEIDVDALRSTRRGFALQCTDWTERRPHVAGAVGAALLARLVALGWLARRRNTRALRVPERGVRGLREKFGVRVCGQ